MCGRIARENSRSEFGIEAAHIARELGKGQIDCAMQITHAVTEILHRLLAHVDELTQFLAGLIGEPGRLRSLLRCEPGDAECVNMVSLGSLQFLFSKSSRTYWVDQGNCEAFGR